MRRFFSEQFSATFAGDLHRRLSEPRYFGQEHPEWAQGNRCWLVSGILTLKAHEDLSQAKCKMVISVSPDWLIVPPKVKVPADFIRQNCDWHVNDQDGSLCYVLQQEWADRLGGLLTHKNGDVGILIDYAATWCLASTDSLVTRHLIAKRHGIEKWPEDWAAYAHGDDGTREYLRQRKKPHYSH